MDKGMSTIWQDEVFLDDVVCPQNPIVIATGCVIKASRLSVGMGVFTKCAVMLDSLLLSPYDFDAAIDGMTPKERMMIMALENITRRDFGSGSSKMPGAMFNDCCVIIHDAAVEMSIGENSGYLYFNDMTKYSLHSRDSNIVLKEEISRPHMGLVGKI